MRKKEELEYYTLLAQMSFDSSLSLRIIEYLVTHEKQMNTKKQIAYMGDVPAYPIQRFSPFVRLCALVTLLPYIKFLYKRSNIPDNIIIDTFQDITLRLNLYQATYHQDGLSSDDVVWFRHLYHAKIFKLHTLQFQLFEMIYLDESTIGED